MNYLLVLCFLVSSNVQAGWFDDILDSATGSDDKSVTIDYRHVSDEPGVCEDDALDIVEGKALSECRKKFNEKCELRDEAVITDTEYEDIQARQPSEVYYAHETNKKGSCHKDAPRIVRQRAVNKCIKDYGQNAKCRLVGKPTIYRQVSKNAAAIGGTFGGMFKKYNCTAHAIAEANIEDNVAYTCEASATAKVKANVGDLLDNVGGLFGRRR